MTTTTQTQITFKVDSVLKEKIMKKVKKEGITLKAFLVMAMRAYVNDEIVLGLWRK